MFKSALTPIEIVDVGLRGETLAYLMYSALAREIRIPLVHRCLVRLKEDAKEHRKTLRLHRQALFCGPLTVAKSDAAVLFGGVVDVDGLLTRNGQSRREALIQALCAAIRFQECGAHFYRREGSKLPYHTHIFLSSCLKDECDFHSAVLGQQIEIVRRLRDEALLQV